MEGNFSSKGAPRMGEIKYFQAGTHVNQQVSEKFSGSLLPVESFLHIHTWHTKYPKSCEQCSLEFDIKYAGIAGIAAMPSTSVLSPSISGTARLIGAPASWMNISCLSTRSATLWSRRSMPWVWIHHDNQPSLTQATIMLSPLATSRLRSISPA